MVLTAILICAAMALMAIVFISTSNKKQKQRQEEINLTQYVSSSDPLLVKFSKDKYKDLYVYRYKEFLLLMIETMKANGKMPEYKEFNFPISNWVADHSIDPIMDTDGWFRWIEKFSMDNEIFALNIPAVHVRNKADKKVRDFVKRLDEEGQLIKCSDVDNLSESIFIKASIDNFIYMQNAKLAK